MTGLRRMFSALALVAAVAIRLQGQDPPGWTAPFPPFRIAGNLYYVGSKELASYLIATPEGNVLINSDLPANASQIVASVEKLGFKIMDTKILLISHAHRDHDAGSWAFTKLTGAKYMVMDADVPVVESGGREDFAFGGDPKTYYAPAKVDHILHDGEKVTLGGTTLIAHLTAGHTKGCTTWTMQVIEGGMIHNVAIVGGPYVLSEYKLLNNPKYPTIAEDYARGFTTLKSLPVDIFLGAHGAYFDMEAKYAKIKAGAVSPFIDPAGYKAFIADREKDFLVEWAKQKGSAPRQ